MAGIEPASERIEHRISTSVDDLDFSQKGGTNSLILLLAAGARRLPFAQRAANRAALQHC